MGEISCSCIIQCIIKAHAFMQGSKDSGGSPPECGNSCTITEIEQAAGIDFNNFIFPGVECFLISLLA